MSYSSRLVRDMARWRDTLLSVLRAWNRHQVWKILTAIVVIWIVSGTALHFAERGTNPPYKTWRDSLWNVWIMLFSGIINSPDFRRRSRWCRLGWFVHGQRGVDPDRTRTKES